jgi:hypothetical protein
LAFWIPPRDSNKNQVGAVYVFLGHVLSGEAVFVSDENEAAGYAGVTDVTMRIGDLRAKMGKKSKAKKYYIEALKLYYEIGMKTGVEDARSALEKHGLTNRNPGEK